MKQLIDRLIAISLIVIGCSNSGAVSSSRGKQLTLFSLHANRLFLRVADADASLTTLPLVQDTKSRAAPLRSVRAAFAGIGGRNKEDQLRHAFDNAATERAPVDDDHANSAFYAIQNALHSGDPLRFYRACSQHGYSPPEDDEIQSQAFEAGRQQQFAEAAALQRWGASQTFSQADRTAGFKRTRIFDYEEFGRQLSRSPRISKGVFTDIPAKKRILRESGYSQLKGRNGRVIPIQYAPEAQIGLVFLSVLKIYRQKWAAAP